MQLFLLKMKLKIMICDYNEFLNEEHNEVIIEVDDKNELIDKLIDKLSFSYKKRKDKYVRPVKITGNNKCINIHLSNKDNIKISYNDGELKIHINDKLVYFMDVKKEDVITKCYNIYTDYLKTGNFKIKKSNPFEQFDINTIINDEEI